MLFLSLLGCKSNDENKTIGVWKLWNIKENKMSNSTATALSGFSEEMENDVINYYGYSFISFYSDTGCIIRKGVDFIHADWKTNETKNTIYIKSKNSNQISKQEIVIKVIADSMLVLTFKPDKSIVTFYGNSKNDSAEFAQYINSTEFILFFRKDYFRYLDEKDDIHSFENNSWRIKPNSPENRDQIKERLKGSINYTRIFVNDAFIRGLGRYNTRAVFAPVRLYDQGVGLVEKEKISQEWIDVFYSQEQAMEAYQMLKNAFDKDINANDKGNWVLTDMDLLRQILGKIE
jgi:hypothetical protein